MAPAAAGARQIGKPCLVGALEKSIVALEEGIEPATFRDWLEANSITVLNVAGPCERQRPGVCAAAARGLETLWPAPRATAPLVYTSCTLPH